MAAVFDVKRLLKMAQRAGIGLSSGQIVTGRHNEYTIAEDVTSQAGESEIQIRDGEFRL
jgi:Tfp pilus assembly protein PilX